MSARIATREEVREVAGVLARALAEDPGWIYLFPEEKTRVGKMTSMIEAMVRRAYVGLEATWRIEGAAAVWMPPGRRHVSMGTQLRVAPRLAWLLRRRVAKAWKLLGIMEGHAPEERHWYLAMLGVDPQRQGRGLGVEVLRPVLETCDREGVMAWLETTNPKNHGFYRRLGFEVAEEVRVDGGPTFTFMRRRPR